MNAEERGNTNGIVMGYSQRFANESRRTVWVQDVAAGEAGGAIGPTGKTPLAEELYAYTWDEQGYTVESSNLGK